MKPSAEAVIDIFNYYIEQNNMYLMTQEEHQRYLKKYKVLTELEEWLKKITDNYNSKWEQFITNQNATEEVLKRIDVKIEMLDQVLDKIQELKEKYK